MKFELLKLNYEYNAIEPYIDAQTMEIHHSKHHQGYVNKTNAALEQNPDVQYASLEDLLKNLDKLPESIRGGIQNNGGGVYNHNLFFSSLQVNETGRPTGVLLERLEKDFGSFEAFQEQFENAAVTRFGSGWAWLIENHAGKLEVLSTANQDTPLLQGKPILNLDVWEHAYYLKYQNRRPEYVSNYFKAVNWDVVADRL